MNKVILFFVFFAEPCLILAQTPTLNPPQKTATIILDNNSNSKADPNDKIRYKTTITNSGAGNATGVTYSVNIDGKTTLVASSFKSSPVAVNDAYACTGNVGLNVPAASGLLANDFDDTPAGLTCTAGTFATTQSGSISISANGSFTYSPPVGFTGSDTYAYTLNDGNAVAGVATTDNATITFTISNMIWFVDNSSVAATSDGRLASPFKTLANFNAATTLAGQLIFIKNTGTNYTGGIVLKNTQTLFGTGHTGGANLADVLPFSLASNSNTLPAINGTKPGILNSGGDGISLASGNSIRGVDVGACSDFGIDANGLNVGNLTISELFIANNTGGGFRADNGSGTISVALTSISSTGGANGINLTNCAGTFTVNGGTITNPTGTGVLISGGTVAFTTNTNITDNSGFAVDVDNHDNGNVTFQVGNITSTANGIRVQNCGGGIITFSGSSKSLTTGANTAVTLASNTGATINFTGGGLVLNSTSATTFNATGGGTITVQGTGNTITSTTGTALNVVSTTIGASNLRFQSISANGATNGIILNTTGTSGGLVVTGTGSAGTGGTIQNSTGDGVVMTSTQSPNLSFMNINDNAGGATDDGMVLTNITGSVSFTSLSISGSPHNGITFDNFNTNLTSFVMTSTTITCPSGFPCQPSGSVGNDGILLIMRGTSILTSGSISSCTFSGVRAVAVQIQANDAGRIGSASGGVITAPAASNSFTVQNSTFTGNGQGVDMGTSQVSSMAFQVLTNTFVGKLTVPNAIANTASSHAINAFTAAGADTGPASHFFIGKIDGNSIGTQGVKDSGSGFGGGIRVVVQGQNTQGSITVNNNTIREVPNSSIMTFYGQNGAATTGTTTARFKITNNTMPAPSGSNLALCGPANTPCADAGIFILADDGTPVCTVITGNNIYDLTTMLGGNFGIYLAERIGPPAGAQLTVEGSGSITTYLNANNTLAGSSKSVDEGGNVNTVAAGTCGNFPN